MLLANYDINHIVKITLFPCCFPLRLFSTALRSQIFRLFSSSPNDSLSSSTSNFSPNSAGDEQFELMSVPSSRPSQPLKHSLVEQAEGFSRMRQFFFYTRTPELFLRSCVPVTRNRFVHFCNVVKIYLFSSARQ